MHRIIGITFLELSTCQYRDYQDRYFMYVDRIQIASSLTDCQRKCDSEQSFHCKSVNFDPISRECSLSSEDSVSFSVLQSHLPAVSGSLDSSIAPFQQDSIFSEKGNCEQGKCTNMFSVFDLHHFGNIVSVTCNQQDMMLTLNFDSPFHGRVYTKSNPAQCFVNGIGQTQLQVSVCLFALYTLHSYFICSSLPFL